MLDSYDQTTNKPQLTRADLDNMRPQDIVQAQREGRLQDLTTPAEKRTVQGKDWQ